MKAKELRIGNIIRVDNIAKEIDDQDLIDILRFKYSIKPIPLTEEWLLRFGFEYIEHWPNYRIPTNDGYYNSIQLYENEWHYNNDSSDAGCYYVATIKYVHQLQNLYFAINNTEL